MESERKYFIENGASASYFQWLTSKGTNYTCYVNYMNSLDHEQSINNKIDFIRTIIYAIHKPIQFTFFYWTLLIFILHKFNFKKPVMKIVLAHFILRSLGDIVNKFGDLMPRYYANTPIMNSEGQIIGYQCKNDSSSPEMHPLRWFLTRQIGCILWCVGEMIADWYPLLRTRAVAKDQKCIWIVYVTCALFNLSKLSLIILHWTLSPTELYDEHGVYRKTKVDMFYFNYWIIHLVIIYASVIYDFSVYYVVRKSLSQIKFNQISFLKKFKSISQYRILVSAGICVIFLPIVSVTIIIKFYYYFKYNYHNLEFSFDEIRQSINNVQYFMIFIDQILLLRTNEEKSQYSLNIRTSQFLSKNSNNKYQSLSGTGTLVDSAPTYISSPDESNTSTLYRNNYKNDGNLYNRNNHENMYITNSNFGTLSYNNNNNNNYSTLSYNNSYRKNSNSTINYNNSYRKNSNSTLNYNNSYRRNSLINYGSSYTSNCSLLGNNNSMSNSMSNSSGFGVLGSLYSNNKRTISTYDNYIGTDCEWNYLSK